MDRSHFLARTARGMCVVTLWLLLSACAVDGTAQNHPVGPRTAQAAQRQTGAVRGTVLDADTRYPLRFALVMLESKRSPLSHAEDGQITVTARTDANGNFDAMDVPPGDYFVMAICQGYTPERDRLQAAVDGGANPVELFASFPSVRVLSAGTSEVTLTLEHGASLAGTVRWDDGSPAAGVAVTALSKTPNNSRALPAPLDQIDFPLASATQPITDDQGNYRIPGLPAGEYVIQGVLQVRFDSQGRGHSPGDGFYLRTFAPGTPSRSDAMVFPLMKEERRDGANLIVSLHGMHTVTGQVVGVGDGSPPVTAGQVMLTDTQNPESEHRSSLSAQGEFRLPNVPPGRYELKIESAHDEARQYLDYSQSILVGDTDITGVRIVLTPSTRR